MRILQSTVTELRLQFRRPRLLFLVSTGLFALLVATEAVRLGLALTLGESAEPATLRRALALDPHNPELHNRLGLVLVDSAAASNAADGLSHLRRATELNPDEALYWSDLASACEAARDLACADRAFARALERSPMTPHLYWSAANYDLRMGRQDEALELFRRLLDLDLEYAQPVFRACLEMLGTPSNVERGLLEEKGNPDARLAFIDFLSSRGDDDSAYAEWRHLAVTARNADGLDHITLAEVEPYLNHLIDAGRQDEAVAVWTDLQRLGAIAGPGDAAAKAGAAAHNNTLVFNGGFEGDPLNAAFDWRYRRLPFASVAFSRAAPHSGIRSLRVEFTGDRNEEYEPIFEVVPVEAARSYSLSAFVRSEAITSDSGPRLRVEDPSCAVCLDAATGGAVATEGWHQVGLTFSTGPTTRFVRLSVWRPRSRGYPSGINGVFWLDDLSMTEIDPPAEPGRAAPERELQASESKAQ